MFTESGTVLKMSFFPQYKCLLDRPNFASGRKRNDVQITLSFRVARLKSVRNAWSLWHPVPSSSYFLLDFEAPFPLIHFILNISEMG